MVPEDEQLTRCQPLAPLHSRPSVLTPLFLASPMAPSPACGIGEWPGTVCPYSCSLCTVDSRTEGVLDRVTVAEMKYHDEKQVMGKRVYLG